MTLEELWELFPITLSEHKSRWRERYEEEKQTQVKRNTKEERG